MDGRWHIKVIFLYYISWSISKCYGCIDGSNLNMGAVMEPYRKNSKAVADHSDSEIRDMVNVLSTRFTRVSLYESHDPSSIDSRILKEVAKHNSRNPNGRSISVIAALQSSDMKDFEVNLGEALSRINESKQIHSGTVTGLIISSSYFQDLRYFKEKELTDVLSISQPSIDLKVKLLAKLAVPMHEFRRISEIIRITINHPERRNLSLGIRSGNCEDMENKLVYAASKKQTLLSIVDYIDELARNLDFVICHMMPSVSPTSKESTASLIFKTNKVLQFFKQRWPSVNVILETGWPSDGKSIDGVEGSVSSMKQFWCEIDKWSKENSVQVNVYTAFDAKYVSEDVPNANFGWFIRALDEQSGLPVFIDKIHYTPPADNSVTWIVMTTFGCMASIAVGIIFAYWKVRSAKNRILTKKDLHEFRMGYRGFKSDDTETEDALRFPYDSSYEIAQSRICIDEGQLLGKGAFGFVYGGKIDDTDAKAAFKVTKQNCATTSIKSLLSEIKILIHVGYHPNVVSIIGACTADIKQGKVVIAIELCENGSLEKYLKAQKITFGVQLCKSDQDNKDIINTDDKPGNRSELLVKKLVQLSYEVASGMEHIAWKNVIHADLSARNILLTVDGTAKITDFGLSRRLYEYTNYVKKNQEPMPWRWMALESLEQLTFSTKSDVWSFGVTLYEIFSLGDIPYPGLAYNQNFTKQLRQGLQLERPSWAPPEIYEIMKSCFTIDPQQRPTFTELKRSFQNSYPELDNNEYLSTVGEDQVP